MRVRPGLDENFRFIALEVQKQIDDTRAYVVAPNPDLHETIAARDDYVDHLKSVVENKCFALVAQAEEPLPTRRVNQIRAIQAITTNLERIGDYCVNIVGQMGYLSQPSFITRYDCDAFFDVIREALALVVPVTFEPQIQPALQLCRSEHRLDELYRDVFHAIVKQLHERAHTEDLITALFIVRYLERIGDALLNIGEALIFAIVGEKLKVHQYEALEGSLVAITQAQGDSDRVPRDALHIESFWDSRSGCRIGRLRHEGNELAPRWVIFKEGRLKKIEREKSNLERWSAIEPGLVPLQSLPQSLNWVGGTTTAGFFQYDRYRSTIDGPVKKAGHVSVNKGIEFLFQAQHFIETWLANGKPEVIDPYDALETPPLP